MNKLILALLLSFAMTAHAQVSGPGNTFGGGGSGSGETESGGGVTRVTNGADSFAIGCTEAAIGDCTSITSKAFFDTSTGSLVLSEPGAGISVAPSPTIGSGIVLSEAANHAGAQTFTLKVGDAANLTSDLTCTIDASGTWTGDCPASTPRNITWGLLPTTVLSSDGYLEIVDSNVIGTGATDVTVTTVPGTIALGQNFTFNTAGVYEITYGFTMDPYTYTGGDTTGCFSMAFYSDARSSFADAIAWTTVSDSVQLAGPVSTKPAGIKSVTWVGNVASGENWGLWYDQCLVGGGRLNFSPNTSLTYSNFYKIERLN